MRQTPQEQPESMEFPRREFESVCFHAIGLVDQNREYLQMHLRESGDAPTRQALADMELQTARLERTLSEMMDLMALEEDPVPSRRGFDLCSVLRQAASLREEMARQAKVHLTVSCEPDTCPVLGHGVSYCATCDAFFYRGKDVAVLGSGEYALHEAQALLPVAKSVTLLANGQPLTAEFPAEVAVRPEKVEAILGEQRVSGVQLAGGETVALDGVFVALGVAGSTALARKLGAEVDGNRIVTDEHMMTTLPGLYAAGDCTGGLLQVAKAVYEGALAGSEAAKALRKG